MTIAPTAAPMSTTREPAVRRIESAVLRITVITGDGSVGVRGDVPSQITAILERADADVVYAVGPQQMLRAVAGAAEQRGAWSQVALETPMPCGTGLCQGCPVPVIGEDGASRLARGCVDGPIFRGDRVDWAGIG